MSFVAQDGHTRIRVTMDTLYRDGAALTKTLLWPGKLISFAAAMEAGSVVQCREVFWKLRGGTCVMEGGDTLVALKHVVFAREMGDAEWRADYNRMMALDRRKDNAA